jgi:hypothetical protein
VYLGPGEGGKPREREGGYMGVECGAVNRRRGKRQQRYAGTSPWIEPIVIQLDADQLV